MAALNTDHLALSVTTQPHSSKPHSRAEMVAQGASTVTLQNMAPNISRMIFAESLNQLGEATSIPCQAWNKGRGGELHTARPLYTPVPQGPHPWDFTNQGKKTFL